MLKTSIHLSPHASLLTLLALACAALWGCSGPQPVENPAEPAPAPPPEQPLEPDFELLTFEADGLVRREATGSRRDVLIPGARFAGLASREPNGDAVALSLRRADSTALVLVDSDGVRLLHGGGDTYSTAWAPASDRLAFGFRADAGGDVLIAGENGFQDPGCSASLVAAHWPDPSHLVTGDGANRYVVDVEGCETVASLDVRKMHHIAYPYGRDRMAYVYRDLVYDRANRSYVPDSSLYTARLDGSDARELFDSAYRPRHLAWSPDGTTLAFDVRLQDPPHRRRVILADSTGGYSYVLPPAEFPDADAVRAAWSPSGRHVAFELRRGGSTQAAVRTFGRTSIIAAEVDSTWGWVDDETLAVVTTAGTIEAYSIDGELRFALDPDVVLVDARSAPASDGM